MTKRMLIDDTQPEETRVVIVNGNKVEDFEIESSNRKQIKGNIYLAKVMRIEPSLQAAFVDYGGNKHGFLAFGEIHPDYYNVSDTVLEEIEKEVDEAIEAKKQYLKERELERERYREEKARERARIEEEKRLAEEQALANEKVQQEVSPEDTVTNDGNTTNVENTDSSSTTDLQENTSAEKITTETELSAEVITEEDEKHRRKKRILKKRIKKQQTRATAENSSIEKPVVNQPENSSVNENAEQTQEENSTKEEFSVMAADTENDDPVIHEEVASTETLSNNNDNMVSNSDDDDVEGDDDDDDDEYNFEVQRKLMKLRKLFHHSTIQDVIKEGQILLVQVVKEERGNKGAALTTYLSLAGRYCVLMPNRIKSGGVSRKITNVSDRKRLKNIVKELPISTDMSMIVRTAGEDKTKSDIVRDYNYLIRSWNQIRLTALKNKAPFMIHEEGNLIKRALRDMFTKDISEIIVDGESAYREARDFTKILSPHNLKKIKSNRKDDLPLFQRFQVETQLDKLHDTNVQLESGGYLVINPTEALVSIDVNSGRATKEKDLEETALKTNLEAADEIAKQLRMRNLAGLVVVDFIDMDDPKNNLAVEKRMKEAMKSDRARVQIAKMSIFGLLEISRQRMHSSFFESNYQTCPHCQGKGLIRTIESSAVMILRGIEEEGIRSRSSLINVFVPTDVAVFLLNQKRKTICDLERQYNMQIIISADDKIKNVSDYRIERVKISKQQVDAIKQNIDEYKVNTPEVEFKDFEDSSDDNTADNSSAIEIDDKPNFNKRKKERHNRRMFNRDRKSRNNKNNHDKHDDASVKNEPVILYNSHENIDHKQSDTNVKETEGKKTWWRKLIKS